MLAQLYFPILILTLFIIEECYFLIARKYNINDRITQRGSNNNIIICGGGIIFWIATLFYYLTNTETLVTNSYFFIALTLISAVSFIDDIKEVRYIYRLVVQFIAVALLFLQWQLPDIIQWWYILPLFIVAVGIINAYNFMDGVNGMTAAYSILLLVTLSYINQFRLDTPFIDPALLHSITFAVLVFAFYNFRTNARCLAGDVGSISIAFIILYLLGTLIITTGNFAYIALLLVYGIDTVLTIIHRLILHENISQPHRKHIYQILANELHWKHLTVATLYASIQLLITVGLLTIPAQYTYIYIAATTIILSAAYILFIRKYFHLHIQRR